MSIYTLRFNRWLRNLREILRYIFTRKKATSPDNHVVKIKRIWRFAKRIKAKSFIETGTFYGQTTSFASYLFDWVVSIELSPFLAAANMKDFKSSRNVRILEGDSRTALLEAINNTPSPIIFWLDGHYSGGATAGVDAPCPIMEELNAINQLAPSATFCLLIDDRRLFTGSGGYPTIEQLRQRILAIWSDADFSFDDDAIVVIKNGLNAPT